MIPRPAKDIARELGVHVLDYVELMAILSAHHQKTPGGPSAHCVCGAGDREHGPCRTLAAIIELLGLHSERKTLRPSVMRTTLRYLSKKNRMRRDRRATISLRCG